MKKFQVKFLVLAVMVWLGAVSVSVGSTRGEKVPIRKGIPFWNAIGTTEDPKPWGLRGRTWLEIWHYYSGQAMEHCVVDGCLNLATIGGHVVFDENQILQGCIPQQGQSDIYILPICNYHNSAAANCMGMRTEININAVRLINYRME